MKLLDSLNRSCVSEEDRVVLNKIAQQCIKTSRDPIEIDSNSMEAFFMTNQGLAGVLNIEFCSNEACFLRVDVPAGIAGVFTLDELDAILFGEEYNDRTEVVWSSLEQYATLMDAGKFSKINTEIFKMLAQNYRICDFTFSLCGSYVQEKG